MGPVLAAMIAITMTASRLMIILRMCLSCCPPFLVLVITFIKHAFLDLLARREPLNSSLEIDHPYLLCPVRVLAAP